MNARRIEITLSPERWDQLEAARGHEPRASFIKRALESALGASEARDASVDRGVPLAARPASTRTSKSRDELAMERQEDRPREQERCDDPAEK